MPTISPKLSSLEVSLQAFHEKRAELPSVNSAERASTSQSPDPRSALVWSPHAADAILALSHLRVQTWEVLSGGWEEPVVSVNVATPVRNDEAQSSGPVVGIRPTYRSNGSLPAQSRADTVSFATTSIQDPESIASSTGATGPSQTQPSAGSTTGATGAGQTQPSTGSTTGATGAGQTQPSTGSTTGATGSGQNPTKGTDQTVPVDGNFYWENGPNARKFLDTAYRRLGETADTPRSADDWNNKVGLLKLGRGTLYAIATNVDGLFSKTEMAAAKAALPVWDAKHNGANTPPGNAGGTSGQTQPSPGSATGATGPSQTQPSTGSTTGATGPSQAQPGTGSTTGATGPSQALA